MRFEEEYEKFVHYHLKQRKGERMRRLKEGHGYAEKLFAERVWWPAFEKFRDLHPEYEVFDFKDGHRYLDYAFIRPHQILQQFMGAMLGEDNNVDEATFLEKEIVQHAKRLCRPITPNDVCHHFNIENKYARRLLLSLTEKQWMKPASGTIRVRSYELDLDGKSFSL